MESIIARTRAGGYVLCIDALSAHMPESLTLSDYVGCTEDFGKYYGYSCILEFAIHDNVAWIGRYLRVARKKHAQMALLTLLRMLRGTSVTSATVCINDDVELALFYHDHGFIATQCDERGTWMQIKW